MKPSELYEAFHALISKRVPLHVWGACGVGKSQIVTPVAAERKCEFLDILAVQLDPVDLRELSRIAEDRAEWVPPKFLPLGVEGILFLDELTSAPQVTQAGCSHLVPRLQAWGIQASGWLGRGRRKQSSFRTRCSLLDAQTAAEPVRPPRSRTGHHGLV